VHGGSVDTHAALFEQVELQLFKAPQDPPIDVTPEPLHGHGFGGHALEAGPGELSRLHSPIQAPLSTFWSIDEGQAHALRFSKELNHQRVPVTDLKEADQECEWKKFTMQKEAQQKAHEMIIKAHPRILVERPKVILVENHPRAEELQK